MKQVREFLERGQAAQDAVDQLTLRPGRKSGSTRGQQYRDGRRANGYVYVSFWVHADDAVSVRAYGNRKKAARLRAKK